MKRIFILLAVALLSVGATFAEEAVLIDFSLLNADFAPLDADGAPLSSLYRITPEQVEAGVLFQNRATTMDFTNEGRSNFTARQARSLINSLSIKNWDIVLSSSAQSVGTKRYSYTLEAASRTFTTDYDPADPNPATPGIATGTQKVLGVRINFPNQPFNVSARILPPFEIPAFEPQAEIADQQEAAGAKLVSAIEGSDGITLYRSRFEGIGAAEADAFGLESTDIERPDGTILKRAYGVVKNVGTIKSIAVNVYGLNFPHSLSVIFLDADGKEKTYFLGNLNFEGWGELVWDNPQYVTEVRNRQLRTSPLYPNAESFVKFGGFIIQRAAYDVGGDFITYFKDVKIIYDQAVLNASGRDIQDESLWSIIRNREARRRTVQMQQTGLKQVQRLIDLELQSVEDFFTVSVGAGNDLADVLPIRGARTSFLDPIDFDNAGFPQE
ncbi:flagellar filament outer layer protein [Spirochaetia bacterium]|nr:flagellar filament outer layer protein [Spirochaetia bacterium]